MILTLGILPPGCQQEIFNFVNLARLQWGKKQKNVTSVPRTENSLWLSSKVMLGDRWN